MKKVIFQPGKNWLKPETDCFPDADGLGGQFAWCERSQDVQAVGKIQGCICWKESGKFAKLQEGLFYIKMEEVCKKNTCH